MIDLGSMPPPFHISISLKTQDLFKFSYTYQPIPLLTQSAHNSTPVSTLSFLDPASPYFLSLGKHLKTEVFPHLSPSFPGPSFSDFPPGPPVPDRPTSIRQIFDSESFTKSSEMFPRRIQKFSMFRTHLSLFPCLLMLSAGLAPLI